jgi:hypothetical protein
MSVEHADSDTSTQQDAKETLVNILKDSGPEDGYTGKELAARVDVAETTVQDLIPQIREEFNIPVWNFRDGRGYFRLRDEEDFQKAVAAKQEEIESTQQTLDHLINAFNSPTTTGTDPTAEVVAEVDGPEERNQQDGTDDGEALVKDDADDAPDEYEDEVQRWKYEELTVEERTTIQNDPNFTFKDHYELQQEDT